ncbi:MAG: M48 family metalloprotease [Cryobacterium sp.]|nr:M48 family metalloprotease [Oligoflexia bacterium]
MNKVLLGTLAALAVAPAYVAMGCSSDGRSGIFPENTAYIPVSKFAAYTSTEAQFNKTIAKLQAAYAPIFKAQGREYKIISDWEDGTVNAYANQNGNVSEVHMFGGLARHKKVTDDGFVLVICHETGHHIGGAPQKVDSWASNEGQADYFATLKCAHKVWEADDNASIVARLTVPAVVVERCQKGFSAANDIAICERAALGGKSLADTLGDLGNTGDTDFITPDTSVVTETDDSHPAAQCRLDTYLAGAVCGKADLATSVLDNKDATIGTCNTSTHDELGTRPLCWYNPTVTPTPPPTPPAPPRRGSSWPSRLTRT